MDAHPLLRHDFCPSERTRINLYFLLEVCASDVRAPERPSRSGDSAKSSCIGEVSLKGVIEIRESLLSHLASVSA